MRAEIYLNVGRARDRLLRTDEGSQHSPPEAEILPRRGTKGVMCSRSKWPICWMSSIRTPEWPRIKEFMRIKMAPLTHDSGIEVWLWGSKSGSESPSSVEITPACWCCNRALPKHSESSVLVSAANDKVGPAADEKGSMSVGLTTATIASAHAVHALPGVHFGDDYAPAPLESFPDARRVIESDGCIVPRSGGDGRDGEVVTINEDRVSISPMKCSARAGGMTSDWSRRAHR